MSGGNELMITGSGTFGEGIDEGIAICASTGSATAGLGIASVCHEKVLKKVVV